MGASSGPPAGAGDVTRLLAGVAAGEEGAADRLFSLVHGELRLLAERQLGRGCGGASIQTTDLVNEAYLRLFGRTGIAWEGRAHFYFAAARAMRDILVERARRRGAMKRGGDRNRVGLDLENLMSSDPHRNILDVHEALQRLQDHDARCAQVVLLRFFGGFTHEQVAEATGLSVATARREWEYAKAWLRRHLEGQTTEKTTPGI
jgi:RNA polymerase sigma factor (TIGR02999 family)